MGTGDGGKSSPQTASSRRRTRCIMHNNWHTMQQRWRCWPIHVLLGIINFNVSSASVLKYSNKFSCRKVTVCYAVVISVGFGFPFVDQVRNFRKERKRYGDSRAPVCSIGRLWIWKCTRRICGHQILISVKVICALLFGKTIARSLCELCIRCAPCMLAIANEYVHTALATG